jgi:O-antigen/teichoic acid export membrane protein
MASERADAVAEQTALDPGPEVTPAGESEDARNNRNLSDLLQELRVAGLGVQVLFGFLLSLPFTVRFTTLDETERDLYRASLLCAALATALLVSPVAYHRWVFRRHEKGRLLKIANVQALLGLLMVAFSISCAVWLVLIVVEMSWLVALLAAATTASFAVLWFVLPVLDRLTTGSRRDRAASSGVDRPTSSPP